MFKTKDSPAAALGGPERNEDIPYRYLGHWNVGEPPWPPSPLSAAMHDLAILP